MSHNGGTAIYPVLPQCRMLVEGARHGDLGL